MPIKPREGQCPMLKGCHPYGVFIVFATRVVVIHEGRNPLTIVILRFQHEVSANQPTQYYHLWRQRVLQLVSH
jgi:hypothetical protein